MTLQKRDQRDQGDYHEATALAVRGRGEVEGVDLHEFDHVLPMLALAQEKTQVAGVLPGEYYRQDTGEAFQEITIIPVRVQRIRTYWATREFDRESIPACYSLDGRTAGAVRQDGSATMFPGRVCTECEHWTDAPWEQRDRLDWCQPEYWAGVLDGESFEPYLMRLKGVNAKLARRFGAPGTIRSVALRMTSRQETGRSGSYYVMVARTGRRLDEADREMAAASLDVYRGGNAAARVIEGSSSGAVTVDLPTPTPSGRGNILEGTLYARPDMRYTKSGQAVCDLVIETDAGLEYATAWGSDAEAVSVLGEGEQVRLKGLWAHNDYQKRDMLTVRSWERAPAVTVRSWDTVPAVRGPVTPVAARSEPATSDPVEEIEMPW